MNTLVFYRARSVTTFHFHRMQLTTVNRYVKLSFSPALRMCTSIDIFRRHHKTSYLQQAF